MPVLRVALRHPLVVATVAFVCLSGWCMIVPMPAAASEAASGHGMHGHATGSGWSSAGHSDHGTHCAQGACCQLVAKESPRQADTPAGTTETIAPGSVPPAATTAARANPPAPDGSPPTAFVAPLNC